MWGTLLGVDPRYFTAHVLSVGGLTERFLTHRAILVAISLMSPAKARLRHVLPEVFPFSRYCQADVGCLPSGVGSGVQSTPYDKIRSGKDARVEATAAPNHLDDMCANASAIAATTPAESA